MDDGSKDNTAKVVKELMEEDRRIKLLTNEINRGTLYTKTRGILNAKEKYIMTLDHDNFYATKDAFSKLYKEAEKNNLDILGYAGIRSKVEIKKIPAYHFYDFLNYHKTLIITKPNIKNKILGPNKREQSRAFLCLYFIKKDLFLKVIKQLGDEFINRNIDAHDDTILMFLLSRNALSFKHIKDIFYVVYVWPQEYSNSLKFQMTVKKIEREKRNCFSFLTYTEVLLLFTENNKSDKNLAEQNFLRWFLRNKNCRNKKDIMNDALRVSNLYLNNQFISSKTKNEISLYLNKIKQQQ